MLAKPDMSQMAEQEQGVRLRAAVLSLDLGANVGWAVMRTDGAVLYHFKTFPKVGAFGRRHYNFKRWLTEMKQQFGGFCHVVYERNQFTRGNPGIMFQQEGILNAWCEHHGISYEGYSCGTIKKHFTGSGRATKEEMMAAAQSLGYTPAKDHVADALACLSLGVKKYRP